MAMSTIGRDVRQITGETEAIRTKSGLTAGGKPFGHYSRSLVAKDELRLECIPKNIRSSVELMQVMARACGHTHLGQFNADDITTWKKEMADLAGIQYAGVAPH